MSGQEASRLPPAMRSRAFLAVNLATVAGLALLAAIAGYVEAWSDSEVIDQICLRFFHNVELSLPTIYNFVLIIMNAGLLAAVALVSRGSEGIGPAYWAGLAGIFVILGYDEAASVHERLQVTMRDVLPDHPLSFYAWTPIGAAVVLVVALVYRPFLRQLPRRVAGLMVLAGGIYVAGAIGVELIGGWLHYHGEPDARYHLAATVEESLEMIGMTVFGYAVLSHVASEVRPYALRVD